MTTRTGKIAQLPKPIRDDLNHRLENGRQGPELLAWLNALPETKAFLAEKFDNQPITKSNLSDWRKGGFLEWQQDQVREARIQRICESGESLHQAETGDLFENFARIAVAELMADLDGLPKLQGEKHTQYLHLLVRDLARLQNAYNRSRWSALAWTKYNDTLPPEPVVELETANSKLETIDAVVPNRAESQAGDSHDSKPPYNPIHIIHHTKCECGEPCPKCHASNSEYPLDEVLRDKQFYQKHGRMPHDRHGHSKYLMNCDCDCSCDRCTAQGRVALPRDPILRHEPKASDEIPDDITKPLPPIVPSNPILTPHADFLRKMAYLNTLKTSAVPLDTRPSTLDTAHAK
jgi:hypothetical protein